MRRKTIRLLITFLLGTLVVILPACNLSTVPDLSDSATQTFAVLFTQKASLPTTTPTLPISPTPSPTLTVTPIILPTFLTPTPPPRPLYYTLQSGEYPWCIARRFDVDPKELLRINNLSSGMIYATNMVLTIPQTGRTFPPPRYLNPHPATYTVPRSNMTVNAVACLYGDVDPLDIMRFNGLTSSILNIGMTLQIP